MKARETEGGRNDIFHILSVVGHTRIYFGLVAAVGQPMGCGNHSRLAKHHSDLSVYLRRSSVKIGTIQRRLAWPLRRNVTHESRHLCVQACMSDDCRRRGPMLVPRIGEPKRFTCKYQLDRWYCACLLNAEGIQALLDEGAELEIHHGGKTSYYKNLLKAASIGVPFSFSTACFVEDLCNPTIFMASTLPHSADSALTAGPGHDSFSGESGLPFSFCVSHTRPGPLIGVGLRHQFYVVCQLGTPPATQCARHEHHTGLCTSTPKLMRNPFKLCCPGHRRRAGLAGACGCAGAGNDRGS